MPKRHPDIPPPLAETMIGKQLPVPCRKSDIWPNHLMAELRMENVHRRYTATLPNALPPPNKISQNTETKPNMPMGNSSLVAELLYMCVTDEWQDKKVVCPGSLAQWQFGVGQG